LLVASCEGHYVRPDGVDQALAYLLAAKPKLYGVYRASPAGIAGDYTAIFSVEGPEAGQVDGKALVIGDDGAIVFIDFGCDASPGQIAEHLGRQLAATPVATSGSGS